jgi:hypothetical protein
MQLGRLADSAGNERLPVVTVWFVRKAAGIREVAR